MKKTNFLLLTALAVLSLFSSCNKGTEAKEVTLTTQEDSLNYALGVINGDGIKAQYFMNDSTDENLSKFLKAADEAFKSGNRDEMYNYGKKIGMMLKAQKANGLMFDSTLTFKEDLIVQGVLNGMKGFEEGMSFDDARAYFQTTMNALQQKRQEEMMKAQPTMPEEETKSVEAEK